MKNYIYFDSVGSYLNIKTMMVAPTSEFKELESTLLSECSEEWFNALNRFEIAKIIKARCDNNNKFRQS